jgi:hypothetical protein
MKTFNVNIAVVNPQIQDQDQPKVFGTNALLSKS